MDASLESRDFGSGVQRAKSRFKSATRVRYSRRDDDDGKEGGEVEEREREKKTGALDTNDRRPIVSET